MSDGLRYLVQLEIARIGDFGLGEATKKIPTLDRALDRLKSRFDTSGSLAGRIGSAFEGAANSAMHLAKWTAVAGGTAVLGAATFGVVGLNAELEKSVVSLGTIFSAQGVANNVPKGITMAKDVIKDMRADAAKLPGEFSDLMSIYTMGATPAFQAGLGKDTWRKMASDVMAAGVAVQVPLDQAAREFSALLSGRAGAQNTYGSKVLGLTGEKAEKFNKMGAEDRVKALSEGLAKYGGAIDAFSSTYEAASSTLVDKLKDFGLKSTTPLFNRVTGAINEVNSWFDANQGKVEIWAERTGEKLGMMWDSGRAALEKWGPIIYDFGDNLLHKVGDFWVTIEPHVERFGQLLQEALKDPGTLDKLISLGKLYIGLKVGGAIGGGLLGGAGDVARITSLVKDIAAFRAAGGIAGVLSGGTAVSGAGAGIAGAAAGAGVGVVGKLAGVGASSFGASQIIAAGGGTAAMAALGVATMGTIAVGAAAWVYALTEGGDAVQDWANYLYADEQARAEYAATQYAAKQAADNEARMRAESAALMRGLQPDFSSFMMAIQGSTAALGGLMGVVGQQAGAYAVDQYAMRGVPGQGGKWFGDQPQDKAFKEVADVMKVAAFNKVRNERNEAAEQKEKQREIRPKFGGGNIHIHLQQTITTNRDPSRVALTIRDELGKLARQRTSSPSVPNYSRFEK